MSQYQIQLEAEQTIAQREVFKDISHMVHHSNKFKLSATELVGIIGSGLQSCTNKNLEYCNTQDVILGIIATIISNGYGKLSPLQSVAARAIPFIPMDMEFIDKYHLSLEMVSAVGLTSEFARLVDSDGTRYIVSEYKHPEIDKAIKGASHPMPLLVAPKAIKGIDDNAYRSDNGYHVMLGSRLNHHDNPIPVRAVNFLSRVAYAIEDALHSNRPMKVAKSARVNHKVKEQLEYNSKLHTLCTYDVVQYLLDNGNKFYFAHSICKRIRTYSVGYQLNLQGGEYDKSLLEFHRKMKLTKAGYEQLLITTANAFGKDKLPKRTRLLWAYTNLNKLEQLSPFADKRLTFDKCVRAIRTHQQGYAVGIPVHLDATASGLQVNGCLMGCVDTLLATNAIPNTAGLRMDVYTQIYNFMKAQLPLLNLSRTQVKDATIPAVFGSEAEPKKLFGENVETFWSAFESMHGAYWYLKILPQLWRDDITEYSFTLPDGYRVYIPVVGPQETEVFIECLGDEMTLTEEVIGRKEQSKCFLANITHSLDGYILRNIVAKCEAQGIDIMCIHDSFGVHPNHAEQVCEWYRIELANLVLLNPLPKILEQIFGMTVQLPNYGVSRADLAMQIRDSEYALD
jgi:hypothetical protein